MEDRNTALDDARQRIQELEARLARQTRQLQFFVQHAPASMAMFDLEMRYLVASEKYVWDWIGKRDYLGRSHYELFPDVPERWKESHKRCMRGVTESCREDRYEHRDGSVDFIDWVVTPWYDEQQEVGGMILFAERVNERVEDKQKLLRFNRQIRQSKEQLESLVYALSHNLQQPLQACLSVLELQTNEAESEAHTYLQATHRRMLASLRDFLRHTRLDGHTHLHQVDLNVILQEILGNLQVQIEQKQLQLHLAKLPVIQANEFEMMALFQNLIGNAIRHNQHPQPELHVLCEQQPEDWLISVRDNGPGIAPEQQAVLFQHQRAVAADKDENDLGIGLPFCRRIVKSMNGKIQVESRLGEGTTFHISLPRDNSPA